MATTDQQARPAATGSHQTTRDRPLRQPAEGRFTRPAPAQATRRRAEQALVAEWMRRLRTG